MLKSAVELRRDDDEESDRLSARQHRFREIDAQSGMRF
jgi:hypothetical protein